jgi:hypothetical protein
MFLGLYIQIPYPVSTRSAPAFRRRQQKFRESIRSSDIEFAPSKPELESTTQALPASTEKAAVAFEHVSVAESSTVKQGGGTAPGAAGHEFNLIDGQRLGSCRREKLAFFQLNYSRSASTPNITKTVGCAPGRNRRALESQILAPDFTPRCDIEITKHIRVARL